MSKQAFKYPPAKYRVGDRVRLTGFAWQGGIFEIVEDRGNIGVGGRRTYSIKKTWADTDDQTVSFPEDDLEAAPENNPAGHTS